jgi:hypothetical protein
MPYSVRCKACSSSFAIPDEIWDKRVRGRMATLKCRSCKAEIHVDGTKEGVVQPSLVPPPEPGRAPEPERSPEPESERTPVVGTPAPAQPVNLPPAVAAAAPAAVTVIQPAADSATTTSPGLAAPAAKTAESPAPPAAVAARYKPIARAAQDITAADVGWSLMPPPAELEKVGIAPTPVVTQSPAAATATDNPPATPVVAKESPASLPPQAITDEAVDPNLWVVSYGESDDRELTEKQIAAELIKGKITLSTIVWQEGMPEWLPISGVKVLSKYAPSQKPAPARQVKPSASKASAQTARTASATTSASAQAGSSGPRQPAPAREKQPSSTQLEPKLAQKSKEPEPKGTPKTPSQEHDQATHPVAAEVKAAKGPPPLARAAEKSGGTKTVDAKAHGSVTAAASKVPGNKAPGGGKPPAFARRAQSAPDAEDVVTSAPNVADALKPQVTPQSPKPAATAAKVSPQQPAAKAVPSQRPSAKSSMRPPKPVETATSLVVRRDASTDSDLVITDEDFLAMQRRFPKWALPAAIVGGIVAIGLIAYAARSCDEPPPLPVAPTVTAAPILRENPANQAQPRHPQPDLNALPTGAAVPSEEKDFARLFAQSASKTNSTFDSKAAEHAAQNIMELAARCRVAPDPAGQARVVVTFSTAGQVLSVQVGSPYANTATGRCIDRALRTIKIRAFQGEPGRLPLTVPIH